MQEYITHNFKETQKLGELLALELRGGEVLCMDGELGAGKTTFTQGLLKGLKVKGPYTSPTFLIMKEYEVKSSKSNPPAGGSNQAQNSKSKTEKIYHFDVYRVGVEDILDLGWKEIISDDKNVVIVEWPERVEKILPKNSIRIKFEWLDENQRKITFN